MGMITVDQVKTYTGITDDTQDDMIAVYIPIVESSVKTITGNRYTLQGTGYTTAGSKLISVSSITPSRYDTGKRAYEISDINEYIESGAQVNGYGIPVGAYVDNIYNESYNGTAGPCVELSANATASGIVMLVFGLPISLLPVVAKGVLWKIKETSTAPMSGGWKSRSMGPLSVDLGSNSAIDNRSGMPAWFVSAFPRFMGGH